jgi:RNA polymerase sigma-70 factor (ECF subfamily)
MKPADNDRGLIPRARQGDRQALQSLSEKYQGLVESVVRSEMGACLRGRVVVADIVQDTLLNALESIELFRGDDEETFKAWLLTIARRQVQGQGRRLGAYKGARLSQVSLEEKISSHRNGLEELWRNLAAGGSTPSKALRREERFQRLQAALASLSPDYKQVIVLARLDELSMKEVARRMERSPKAVSVLLWRALLKLKTAFGHTDSFRLIQRSEEEAGHGG